MNLYKPAEMGGKKHVHYRHYFFQSIYTKVSPIEEDRGQCEC
jgi:hypothetical protein